MVLIRGTAALGLALAVSVFFLLAWQHVMPMAMPGHALCPPQLAGAAPPGRDAGRPGVHTGLFIDTAAQLKPSQWCHMPAKAGCRPGVALGWTWWHGVVGGGSTGCPWAAAAGGDRELLSPFGLVTPAGPGDPPMSSPVQERGLDPVGGCWRGTSLPAHPQSSQGWCWHSGLEMPLPQ